MDMDFNVKINILGFYENECIKAAIKKLIKNDLNI